MKVSFRNEGIIKIFSDKGKQKRMFCYQTPDYLEIDKRNFFKQKGNDFFKKEVESWSIRKEGRTMERTEILVHIKDYPIPHT